MSQKRETSGEKAEYKASWQDQSITQLINENKQLISERKQIIENLGRESLRNTFRYNDLSPRGNK